MATATLIILMIYVVLSLGGSLTPEPIYPRHIVKDASNTDMDRTIYQDRTLHHQDVLTPKCPQGLKFCESVINYPGDAIRKALKVNNSFSTFFKRRIPMLDTSAHMSEERLAVGRDGGAVDGNEERVCDVQEQVIRPKVATNKNGEMKFIVNEGSEYKQFVKIEKCRMANASCHRIQAHLSRQQRTVCREKRFTLLMLSYDEQINELLIDDFDFPVACLCYLVVRQTDRILN